MIIDDNQDFQNQYSMLAEMAGYGVESILDVHSALQRLETDSIPTLILLDSIMQNINRDEILTALRANEKWAPEPVYILTADVRFAPGLYNRLPDAPQADGILEKGANAIVQVWAILVRYKRGL